MLVEPYLCDVGPGQQLFADADALLAEAKSRAECHLVAGPVRIYRRGSNSRFGTIYFLSTLNISQGMSVQ